MSRRVLLICRKLQEIPSFLPPTQTVDESLSITHTHTHSFIRTKTFSIFLFLFIQISLCPHPLQEVLTPWDDVMQSRIEYESVEIEHVTPAACNVVLLKDYDSWCGEKEVCERERSREREEGEGERG